MSRIHRTDSDPGWVNRELRELKREIRELRAARSLEAAAIGQGGLIIKGGDLTITEDGNILITGGGGVTLKDGGTILILDGGNLRMGNAKNTVAILDAVNDDSPGWAKPDGSPQPRVAIRRDDGSLALTMWDPQPLTGGFKQILSLWDANDNPLLQEDVNTFGLARPWLAHPLFPATGDSSFWPATDSGTFVTLWNGYIVKQNPWLSLSFFTVGDSGTTGKAHVKADGNVLLGGQDINALTFNQYTAFAQLPGGHGDQVYVELQCRRTAGTGKVKAAPIWVRTQQTP